MRIAVCADVHVGNFKSHGGPLVAGINRRCALALGMLRRAVQIANEENADEFWILGDLTDSANPSPQVVTAIQNVLREAACSVRLLRGNHDMVSMTEGDHALGPYEHQAVGISIVEELYSDGHAVVAVPYCTGKAAEWLPATLNSMPRALLLANDGSPGEAARPTVLALHLGISDDDTPPYLRDAADSVPLFALSALARRHGFKVVLAGNWHQHRRWDLDDLTVVQVGALCPVGWKDEGLDAPNLRYGTVVLYDTDAEFVVVREVPGPRFVDTRQPNWAELNRACDTGDVLYLRWRVPADKVEAARALLAEEVEAGRLVAGEVIPDGEEAEVEARTAATVARASETLAEALAEYVAAMPIPEGVDRSKVLDMARSYLSK